MNTGKISGESATPKKADNTSGCGCLLFVLIVLIVVVVVVWPKGGDDVAEPTPTATVAPTATPNPDQAAADALEITLESYIALRDAFALVGISDISGLIRTSSYNVKLPYESYDIYAFFMEDIVKLITVNNVNVYEEGVVAYQVQDVTISDNQKIVLATWAQADLESYLKAPSTAKYPWGITNGDWAFEIILGEDGTAYTVNSYVDAENSFGATVRTYFIVTYLWSGGDDERPVAIDVYLED